MKKPPALLPPDLGLFKVEVPAPYGRFRAPAEICQIRAQDDLQAIAAWLSEFSDSPNTLANYRKEVERLLMWSAALIEPKPISGLTREDFVAYDRFLADPQPPERWVGPPLPRANPNWRPFSWRHESPKEKEHRLAEALKAGVPPNSLRKGGLAPDSRRQSFDVLRSLYSYLHKVGYLLVNPLSAKTRKRRKTAQRKRVTRYLDRATWRYLVDHIESLPRKTKRDQQHYHRVRWLFYLLYLTRARRAEVANAKMTDFYQDDIDGLWYWAVTGKGSKDRDIPVSNELHAEFVHYRRFQGLPDNPGVHEDTPLVLSVTGKTGLSPKAVYLVVKQVCHTAAVSIAAIDAQKAAKLEQTTTHWLRHTSATHFVDEGGDLRVAKETLGHGSIETTMIYQHAEKTDLHEKSSRLKVRK